MLNYPLKFTPILKEKIWGGTKLVAYLNKRSSLKQLGESWEISDIDNDVSVVSNGKFKGKLLRDLQANYKSELLGKKNYTQFGNKFPLLIKFIDAHQDLSVQVHPNDALSKERYNSFGKTEMWYVMQADEGSKLVLGFDKNITPREYTELLKEKKIMSILNTEVVKEGDAFFIETGTVHAIGAGIVLAEIQQTSDITYRIYDYNRVDTKGNKRDLHTELAVEALNFSNKTEFKCKYSTKINKLNNIVSCEFFKTNIILVKGKTALDYSEIDSFVIFMCVAGNAQITIFNNTETIGFGETILIPASASNVILEGDSCKLLTVVI